MEMQCSKALSLCVRPRAALLRRTAVRQENQETKLAAYDYEKKYSLELNSAPSDPNPGESKRGFIRFPKAARRSRPRVPSGFAYQFHHLFDPDCGLPKFSPASDTNGMELLSYAWPRDLIQ